MFENRTMKGGGHHAWKRTPQMEKGSESISRGNGGRVKHCSFSYLQNRERYAENRHLAFQRLGATYKHRSTSSNHTFRHRHLCTSNSGNQLTTSIRTAGGNVFHVEEGDGKDDKESA